MERKSNLTINSEVLEQMAFIAVKEVEIFKAVHVTEKNGAVALDIHIKIYESFNAKQVAEAVQASVKEKLQNMTGNAITGVNVTVADVVADKEK